MTPERWQRVKEIAVEAMDLAPDQREAYLQTYCGDDEELRQSVEKLLKADAESGDTFERVIAGAAQEVHGPSATGAGESVLNQTISHYRITEKLGAGGMGVVYKAEDTKLERAVALKFLAPHLVADEDVRRRFHREAKAAAALTHPNIAVIHEIDEADGHSFIAMEFVEGLTLTDKIAERPLKLSEALDIALQAAQGLQAAHDRGVVHRDIKSANLMLTPRGQVKIMDFGLAQLAEQSKLTATTTILGTPSYMSPEQALGEKTDRRTDLWSLGVVLYEMVAGRQPFQGERQEAVLYGITNEEPEPVTALRSGLPLELDWLISKTLAKNRDERYQNAEDLLVDLQALRRKVDSGTSKMGASRQMTEAAAAHSQQQRRRSRIILAATAAAGLVLGIVATLLMFGPEDTAEAVTRKWVITPPEQLTDTTPFVISPDGRHIVWPSGDPPRLMIRDIDQEVPREIEGTEGALSAFWSPDSQSIGFGTASELSRIPIQGGAPRRICTLPGDYFMGGTWSPDDSTIIFASSTAGKDYVRLFEVTARGGSPELLLPERERDATFDWGPHFITGGPGARLLAFARGNWAPGFEIVVRNLDTTEEQVVGPGSGPTYSATGHLLFMTNNAQGGLWALPFSMDTLQAEDEKFEIARDGAAPSIASDGTLVYSDFFHTDQRQLVLLDRKGEKLEQVGVPQDVMGHPELSPDGRRVVVKGEEKGNLDIWIHEVGRPLKTPLTSNEDTDASPTWLPSGREVAFSSGPKDDGKKKALYIQSADGTGTATPLLAGASDEGWISDWSSDARFALSARLGKGIFDLWYLRRKDDGGGYEAVPYLKTDSKEKGAQFSPDDRWVVYTSNETGRDEVYLSSFPDKADKTQVSLDGGTQPRWSGDGKTIFYVEEVSLMAVSVATVPGIAVSKPSKLFESPALRSMSVLGTLTYDVSADGQSFVVIESVQTKEADIKGHVVQNWFAEYKDN
jgi:serine/threonine protein kinase